MLKKMGDIHNPNSLAARMRKKRFAFFRQLVDDLPRPLSILDVGGSYSFWKRAEFDNSPGVSYTVLNRGKGPPLPPHVAYVEGDARSMPEFADGQFDIVFSNSTIEHVGDFQDQFHMAQEIQRIGKRYFVQTPNRYFPIEPHFLFPWFQFLPIPTRVWLLRNFKIGHIGKIEDRAKALTLVKEIRLLTEAEMRQLFPLAAIYRESLAGVVKSIVAYKF